ncbi:DOMON-like domain-containing protein [Propionivibrio dicarboxylicus]|uniref:DOMON-like domain-containing protein n=1 Tax=Propionivibrio dicarboxylicus TaxID=83767 RepID=A0A1G8BKS8_9RHOO|nr:DOMON-like domain-containing protein [Propionivibrio dicarboxylicus]SDH33815.1 hypothetical protein SAMN05660652_01538 [Propionivibrio dicarboxylicus]
MHPTVHHLPLGTHPTTPAPMVGSLDVVVTRRADALELRYCLRGDIARLRVPGHESPERRDGLWEHTCFEAFIAVAGQSAYREFNFSPAGHWAVYDFSATRQPAATPVTTAPSIDSEGSAGRLELAVTLTAAHLPPDALAADLEIGLCAVIECVDMLDDALSYWALHHPGERPDFHRRDGFAFRLAAIA